MRNGVSTVKRGATAYVWACRVNPHARAVVIGANGSQGAGRRGEAHAEECKSIDKRREDAASEQVYVGAFRIDTQE